MEPKVRYDAKRAKELMSAHEVDEHSGSMYHWSYEGPDGVKESRQVPVTFFRSEYELAVEKLIKANVSKLLHTACTG